MNSNRNSTVSGGFISKQSNGTDGASSAEPIKRTGQSGVSSTVPIKHYHPLRCQACFFWLSSSLNRFSFSICCGNIVSSDSNKRFVYDVGAYNSDDDKADENEADGGGSLEEGGDRSKDVNGGSSHKEGYISTYLFSPHTSQADLNSALRPVEIVGNLAFIEKAEKLINEIIAQGPQNKYRSKFQMMVGVIIGRGDYQEHADKVESTDS
ncbi:hypothetical protein IGI04_016765, partial [Brassica rapa subsp. trilocularis]